MKTSNCYYLGYISKTVGYEGSLIAFLDVDDPSSYNDLESVFIMMDGKLVPFFVADISVRAPKGEVVIRFEDIDSIGKARHLCKRDMYLPLSRLRELPVEAFYYHDLVGYEACDAQDRFLGVITAFLDYPGNPLFSVSKHGEEDVLFPVADEFIRHIDHGKQRIFLDPPEGLLDLNR
ncbi:MAG: ribosome maturation factor RimM [Bacteroidales bacterium]